MVANRSSAVPPRITAHGPPKAGKLAQRAVFRDSDENIIMSLPKLTGNLFRAGRALAGLTRDDLANRAGLSRDVLRTWEISSESIVPAQYQMLCRAIDALEGEGVRFSDNGVHLQRPAAPPSTVIASERVVA
jgi:DNA-binding transcriptional regulator YiaG